MYVCIHCIMYILYNVYTSVKFVGVVSCSVKSLYVNRLLSNIKTMKEVYKKIDCLI